MAQGERWGFEGGVVPQAAEEPGRPTRSYGEGFGGVGDKAKVSERRLVNDFGYGMKVSIWTRRRRAWRSRERLA